MSEPATTYCDIRLAQLGITDKWNLVDVPDDSPKGYHPMAIFQPSAGARAKAENPDSEAVQDADDDIIINYLNLEGGQLQYLKGRWKKEVPYRVRRYKNPREMDDGRTIKYQNPSGTKSEVFLTPKLVYKYQNSTPIETLFLVEGQFKTAKADLHGLDIIGINGVESFLEERVRIKDTVRAVIDRCEVKRLVILMDADARVIKPDPDKPDKDLAERLQTFYRSAYKFRSAILPLGLEATLAIIHEDHFPEGKGIDDLMCKHPDQIEAIKEQLLEPHNPEGELIRTLDLKDMNQYKLKEYFCLDRVENFYQTYRKQLGTNPFTWRKWRYEWDSEKEAVRRSVDPSCPYAFIGTSVFMRQYQPWPDGVVRERLVKWQVDAIKRDHNSKYLAAVPRYLGFTCVPDNQHTYQREIKGFYNRYEPCAHQPEEEGGAKSTLKFLKHIFGDHYQLALDYLQILYTKPAQRLPILALVSEERKTGKSTFLKWLKAVYPQQMGIYQNYQIKSRFNEDWQGKLIIAVDEASLQLDYEAAEAYKYLNFASSIYVEGKGTARDEIPFFAKFILVSNHERDFLPIDAAEDRFWVIKVKPFKGKEDVSLEKKIQEEIPAFLQYLSERELTTKEQTRMWFTPQQIQTDALLAAKAKSRPALERELHEYIRDQLLNFLPDIYGTLQEKSIKFTRDDIISRLLSGGTRAGRDDITDILRERWKMSPSKPLAYQIFYFSGSETLTQKNKGRYYEFKAEDFLSQEEIQEAIAISKGQGPAAVQAQPEMKKAS